MRFGLPFACTICCVASALIAGEAETVGPCGDPATMAFVGAKTFSAAALRRAVAGDLPLLLARRPEAPREAWLRQVEEGIRLGYREAGFRDAAVTASAEDGCTRVVVEEGPRIRCGAILLPGVRPQIAALAAQALGERRPTNPPGTYELDTAPSFDEPLWSPGAPVDWNHPEVPAERISAALRQAGLFGGRIETAMAVADGKAALTVIVAEEPAAVHLGKVVVAGLPAADGERMRRWLDLPADAPATFALKAAVYERLRASGVFIDVRVVWEDEAKSLPPAMLSILTVDQIGETLRQDGEVMARRIAARGNADLLVTVRPVPGAALPWEEASRSRTCILAARAAMLRRIAGGAELVASTSRDGVQLKAVWSAAHGFAWLQETAGGQARSAVVLGDGQLATERAGRRQRTPMPFPHLSVALVANQGDDRDKNPFSLSVNCNKLGAQPRLMLDLPPAGFVGMLLRSGQETRAVETWDGDVLVLRYPDTGVELRCDPAAGLTARIVPPQREAIVITLRDGIWSGEVAPLLAGGRIPERNPVGTVLGEAIAVIREGVPEASAVPGLARAAAVANSGAIDALLAFSSAPADAATAEAYDIPTDGPRRPRLPTTQYLIALMAAFAEGQLYDRLADDAWPRLLLRGTAMAMCGDMRAAAAAMKPVFAPGRVGPVGCLVFAHAVRLTGNSVLAGLLADAGEQRCDADGLALEARTLAGLAPALLPAMGALAEVMAAVESDPARVGALRGLASTCYGTAGPAARLEAAARQAAALGAGEALKRQFGELRAADTRPTM